MACLLPGYFCFHVMLVMHRPYCKCRGADKSLARPGRKQATFPAFYGTWRFSTTFTRGSWVPELCYWGADKSLARPGRKQATIPTFYGSLRFISTFTRGSWLPELCCRGADESLARPGRKQATFPAFYGTWRFITTFTRVHHVSLP